MFSIYFVLGVPTFKLKALQMLYDLFSRIIDETIFFTIRPVILGHDIIKMVKNTLKTLPK